MSRFPVQDERQRKRNDAISRAMRRSSEARRCPSCGRKGALQRSPTNDPYLTIRVC